MFRFYSKNYINARDEVTSDPLQNSGERLVNKDRFESVFNVNPHHENLIIE